MAKQERLSHCPAWNELNMAALTSREMWRAAGFPTAIFGILFTAIPRLFGATIRTGTLFPEEVTVVWDLPEDEILPPPDLEDLGFRVLKVFELPEYTGENATCLMGDKAGTTFCEVVYARTGTESMTGIVFSSYFPGTPRLRLKTVMDWRASPLEQPEGYINQRVNGTLTDAYEAHIQQLATFPVKPIPTTWEGFAKRGNEDLRVLNEYYTERRIYVRARDFDVEAMLRKKGIRLG